MRFVIIRAEKLKGFPSHVRVRRGQGVHSPDTCPKSFAFCENCVDTCPTPSPGKYLPNGCGCRAGVPDDGPQRK